MQLRVPALGVALAFAGLDVVAIAPVVEPARAPRREIRFPQPDARTPRGRLEHRLARAQVRLGVLGRVDVERHADDQHRPTLQVPLDRAAAILHPAVFPARGLEAVLELHRIARALRVLAQLRVHALAILGMQVAEPRIGRRVPLRARIACHCQPQRARRARVARHVPLPERGARAPQRRGEARLAVAARDLLALAPVDVEQDARDAHRRSVAITLHHAAAMQDPQPPVPRGQQAVLAFEAITAVVARIGGGAERPVVVGMDALLPLRDRHRVIRDVDAESARPRRVDLEIVARQVPVPHRRLRELQRRTEFGGQRRLGGRLGGVRAGVHDRLLSSAPPSA